MKKIKAKNGYIVYKCSRAELAKINDDYIECITCGKTKDYMFIIPTLNIPMCEECFEKWESKNLFEEKDLEFEREYISLLEELALQLNIKIEDAEHVL